MKRILDFLISLHLLVFLFPLLLFLTLLLYFQNKGKHGIGLYIEQDELHITTRTYVKLGYAYHKKLSSKFTAGLGVYAGIQQYALKKIQELEKSGVKPDDEQMKVLVDEGATRKNIMKKLGVNNTAGIVMFAVKSNLVSPN